MTNLIVSLFRCKVTQVTKALSVILVHLSKHKVTEVLMVKTKGMSVQVVQSIARLMKEMYWKNLIQMM